MKSSFWSGASAVPDTCVLFRGRFHLSEPARVGFRVLGATWYQAWLDGGPLLEGPLRYALDHPEYQTCHEDLSAGEHLLAFHVHHAGVETRMLKDTPPFLWCELCAGDGLLPVTWRCKPLESQSSKPRRLNPQLGWIEWRDTRLEPAGWEEAGHDDSDWVSPVEGASPLSEPGEADLARVQTFFHVLKPAAGGALATTFGYAADDPAHTFFTRDRVCEKLPGKGVWRRYDLGRVRLGRPRFRLDVPEGTIIEFALAESLTDGRVCPRINLSDGPSCNLDRFVARGGEQTFLPLAPRGGRFLEVHVVNASSGVCFLEEGFLERGYHAPTEAAFACGDALLETIWHVGIETLRACAEDALTDNPTRERGQWLGDAAAVGLQVSGVAYHDLRLCKRSFQQAALCAREDGLVAGMSPGGCIHLPTYAFQWPVGVMEYYRITGDRSLLVELWAAARRNMSAIRAFRHADGLHHVAGWNFVDWGYVSGDGPVDTVCNLHYLWSLREMALWADAIGEAQSPFSEEESEQAALLGKLIAGKIGAEGYGGLGYHAAALALLLGLLPDEAGCLDFLERHLSGCFPNDPDAPRNDDPTAFNSRLITPYFAHFVLPLFMERGRMDFALDQIRTCWGWMLEQGCTTWPEVFDLRWSHCHQWSGSPTWMLSRHLLGLHPRSDVAPGTFDFRLHPGSLKHASGKLPHPAGGWINISWEQEPEGISCRLSSPSPLRLVFPDGEIRVIQGTDAFRIGLPLSAGCLS